jgi:hypothetical protein
MDWSLYKDVEAALCVHGNAPNCEIKNPALSYIIMIVEKSTSLLVEVKHFLQGRRFTDFRKQAEIALFGYGVENSTS